MLGVDPDQKRLVPLEGWWATASAQSPFHLAADYQMTGDQPDAVDRFPAGKRIGHGR
jgi:hypothetical protein